MDRGSLQIVCLIAVAAQACDLGRSVLGGPSDGGGSASLPWWPDQVVARVRADAGSAGDGPDRPDVPAPATREDASLLFDELRPWRGDVRIDGRSSFGSVSVDGRDLPFIQTLVLLDTRTLADGAHTVAFARPDGRMERFRFQTENADARSGPNFRGRFVDAAAGFSPPLSTVRDMTRKSGAVAADVDRDGDLDLFAWSTGGARLYHQTAPNRFEASAATFPIVNAAGFADIDGDGAPELVVSAFPIQVYRFARGEPVNVTEAVLGSTLYNSLFLGVTAADIDMDGLTDVAIGRMECGNGGPSLVLRNEGDSHLVDVAPALGLDTPDTATFTFAIDLLPGDPDLHVWNLREGCLGGETRHHRYAFTDDLPRLVERTGTDHPTATPMGSAYLDVDADGALDFYVTLLEGSRVWPGPAFGPSVAPFVGLELHRGHGTSMLDAWATALLDANLDGRPDLFVTYLSDLNGDNTTNAFFAQTGPGRFYEFGEAAGLADDHGCEAVSSPDLDGDGDGDLLVGCLSGVRVYRNELTDGAEGRTVVLHGTVSNPDGIHAILETPSGERRLVRGGGQPFAGGVVSESVRLAGGPLTVHWPSGLVQTVPAGSARVLHVTEPRVFTVSRRRVTAGRPEPVEVAVDPNSLGTPTADVRVEASAGAFSTPLARSPDGVWRGVFQPPSARGVAALTVTVGAQTLRVRPRVFVR